MDSANPGARHQERRLRLCTARADLPCRDSLNHAAEQPFPKHLPRVGCSREPGGYLKYIGYRQTPCHSVEGTWVSVDLAPTGSWKPSPVDTLDNWTLVRLSGALFFAVPCSPSRQPRVFLSPNPHLRYLRPELTQIHTQKATSFKTGLSRLRRATKDLVYTRDKVRLGSSRLPCPPVSRTPNPALCSW